MSFALSSAAAASVARVSSRASTRSLRARKAAARPVRAMAAKAEVNQLSDGDKKPLVDSVETFIFDCDGVIVETEELHRKAYNASFKHFGLTIPSSGKVEW